MSRNDVIIANSRNVLRGDDGLGTKTWEYRTLTSKVTDNPRIYSEWMPLDGALPVRGRSDQAYDQERSIWNRITAGFLRCPDDIPDPLLTQGDQLREDETTIWAVLGISSSGPGTVLYAYGREDALLGDAVRGGGV